MLRGALVAFVCGWAIWFWIDKSPAALGPVPWPADGEYLQNFQTAFDLLKQARFKAAFVFLWKAHFIVLSLAAGLLIGAGFNAVSRRMSRNRLIKLYLPDRKKQRKPE
jgi:hypothetical protein